MIEILLEAERNLTMGLLDHAEKLYWQAIESDPQNAIAVVGLARVALERGDDRTAYAFAIQALSLDPENATAVRLETRLAEVMTTRGEVVERPAMAIEAAARAQTAGREELERAARLAPAPAPPQADYPGDRPLGADPAPGPHAETAALEPTPEPVPDDARSHWRPGLFRRLAGRPGRSPQDNGADRDGGAR